MRKIMLALTATAALGLSACGGRAIDMEPSRALERSLAQSNTPGQDECDEYRRTRAQLLELQAGGDSSSWIVSNLRWVNRQLNGCPGGIQPAR